MGPTPLPLYPGKAKKTSRPSFARGRNLPKVFYPLRCSALIASPASLGSSAALHSSLSESLETLPFDVRCYHVDSVGCNPLSEIFISALADHTLRTTIVISSFCAMPSVKAWMSSTTILSISAACLLDASTNNRCNRSNR
jgi:hypothetical protein